MSLLTALSKKTKEVFVSDFILSEVGGSEPARSLRKLHASDVTSPEGFCPREVVLLKKLKKPRFNKKIDACLKITFDEGRDKQSRLNNDWLRNRMLGHWMCSKCKEMVLWSKVPSNEGGKCHHSWYYAEVPFVHPEAHISGSPDAFVYVDQPKYRLVETKIMGQDEFVKLVAPLGEHRIRTQLYLELVASGPTHIAGQVDLTKASILYMLRGHGKKDDKDRISPFKEFLVGRDPKAVEMYIQFGKAVRKSVESEYEEVPSGVCSSLMDKRASKCAVAPYCFSGKCPATFSMESL